MPIYTAYLGPMREPEKDEKRLLLHLEEPRPMAKPAPQEWRWRFVHCMPEPGSLGDCASLVARCGLPARGKFPPHAHPETWTDGAYEPVEVQTGPYCQECVRRMKHGLPRPGAWARVLENVDDGSPLFPEG
jgi:hypothetical protein